VIAKPKKLRGDVLKKYQILTDFRVPPKDYQAGRSKFLPEDVAKLALKEGWAMTSKDYKADQKKKAAESQKAAELKEVKKAEADKNKMTGPGQNKDKE
jgi:hypothetical protein